MHTGLQHFLHGNVRHSTSPLVLVFRPPHRSNPIPGTRGAFCRGVFIFEPEFFNTDVDFLQALFGRRPTTILNPHAWQMPNFFCITLDF
jgi:hypothetical protein